MEHEEVLLAEQPAATSPLPPLESQSSQSPVVIYEQKANPGVVAMLGLLGFGGLAAFLLLRNREHQTMEDPNYGSEGWQAISYGGGDVEELTLNSNYALMGHFTTCAPNLGFLFVSAANTDNQDFNNQITFWSVTTVPNKLLLLDELQRIWILKTGSAAVRNADGTYHVYLASDSEKQEILGKLADGNVASLLDSLVPYADWSVSYTASNGYTPGRTKVHHVLFPEPLNSNDPSAPSTRSLWLMREATIEITPIKIRRNSGIGFKRSHIKIKVSIPGIITYTYMIPGGKGDYFYQHLRDISLDLAWDIPSQNMYNAHCNVPFEYTGQTLPRVKAFVRAVNYWGGGFGLFGRGRVAIENLCHGVEGLRNNAVVWTVQWLNGQVDVTDLGHTFQNLYLSPKAVALAELPSNMSAFQSFCFSWLASTSGNQPKLTGAVLRPEGLSPLNFLSEEEIQALLAAESSSSTLVGIS